MRYYYKTRLTQYVTLAKRVFGVDSQGRSEEAIALEGIARFEAFLDQIGMPIRLADVKVDGKDIPALTADVVRISFGNDGKLRSRPPATREDVEAVFTLALKR
jgi:alcohol dehydrogenase YqhD (iron-dependent ADH family)